MRVAVLVDEAQRLGSGEHAGWDWDLATDTMKWNEGLPALFGHAETVTSAAWRAGCIHPEDRVRVRHSLEKATIVNDGTPWADTYRFRRADGSYVVVIERARVLRDERGPCRVLGAIAPAAREHKGRSGTVSTIDQTAPARSARLLAALEPPTRRRGA